MVIVWFAVSEQEISGSIKGCLRGLIAQLKKSVVNHAVASVKYKEIEGVSLQSSEPTPLSYFYLHSAVCEMLSRLFSCER